MAGLYVHVPFCKRKCGYCDFYSLPADTLTRERYAARLVSMLAARPLPPLDTVYFGGGTPPLLGAEAIASVLRAVRVRPGAEITVECNPESTDAAFLAHVAQAGVNRVSFGLQSTHERQLRRLGRGHAVADVRRAVADARAAGIESISLDVMLALPGQTESSLGETLDFCLELDVPHVSSYLLSIEPGTRFARERIGALCPDEDGQAALYLYAAERLERGGLRQYEISNFARPGFESRHNLCYWTLGDYWGVGPSAHSFFGGRRYAFPPSLERFLAVRDPWELLEDGGPGGDRMERVMLRLRLREGLAFGDEAVYERAAPLIRGGLVRREGDRLSLTPRGFLVSNSVIGELLGFSCKTSHLRAAAGWAIMESTERI